MSKSTSLAFSSGCHNNQKEQTNDTHNISYKNLSKVYPGDKKKPFALIVVSPFNSYFSSEKIFEICQWINNHYEEFAIFFPDKISKYTIEATGYDESKIYQKVKKQDNHTMNRIDNALSMFYESHPSKKPIKLHTISSLKSNKQYQDLYTTCLERFYSDKNFRIECMGISNWVVQKNDQAIDESNDFNCKLALHIAVNYFLFELPITINAPKVLGKPSCDFVYHTIPEYLKNICNNSNLVSKNHNFLVLK